MTINFDSVICLGGFAVGLVGIGYAIGTRKKMKDICNKINKSIDEVSGNIKVDISETVVRKAVDKAVDREVDYAIKRVSEQVVRDLENVSKIYRSISRSITKDNDSKEMTFKIS